MPFIMLAVLIDMAAIGIIIPVLPALVAPGVLWPAATEGQTDPARLAAAGVTLLVGLVTRSTMAAILAGGVTLYALLAVAG